MKRIDWLTAAIWVAPAILMGCAQWQAAPPRSVYKDDMTAVEVRSDPRAGELGHSHPARLSPEQMTIILNGIRVQKRSDPILSLVTGKPDPVHAFSTDEIRLLAPILSQALETAAPRDLITFYRRVSDESLGLGFTSGGLFVEHKALYFVLANHRNRPADGMGHMQSITYEIDPVDDPLFSIKAMSFIVSFSPDAAVMPAVLRPQWTYEDQGKVVVIDLERLLIEPMTIPSSPVPKPAP